jgi:hypothetical protein
LLGGSTVIVSLAFFVVALFLRHAPVFFAPPLFFPAFLLRSGPLFLLATLLRFLTKFALALAASGFLTPELFHVEGENDLRYRDVRQ